MTHSIKKTEVMLPNMSSAADLAAPTMRNQDAGTDYLLVCQASASTICEGSWSFTLETANGQHVLSADDTDLGDLNRLTLLAAVRGLESIDGPASVMLLSTNRYLIRSLAESLPRWRENQFVWEHFGRRIDVQHADLWRRIDRALQIHRVQACLISSRLVSCGDRNPAASPDLPQNDERWLRVDAGHSSIAPPQLATARAQQRRSPETERTESIDSSQAVTPFRTASADSPKDGLRRWLLAGGASQAGRIPRHRFTAADLLDSA